MIRLLFVPFFALVLFSCEESSKEIDPLFYQISKADSVRCMEEILDGILEDASGRQTLEKELYDPYQNIPFCGVIDVFRINMNSRGDLLIAGEFDSTNVSEKVYEFFMFNRNLSTKETYEGSINSSYSGFGFPFYDRYNSEEIELRIDRKSKELLEVRNSEDVTPEMVEYYELQVEYWEIRQSALTVLQAHNLIQISSTAHVRFEFQKSSKKTNRLLKEIAFAFYQMRNSESLRYFNETYLSLYDRMQRKKRKIDKEKLLALEVLHPSRIYSHDWSKKTSIVDQEKLPILPE